METLVKVVGGQIAKFWLTAMSGLAATAFAALAWPAIALSAFNVVRSEGREISSEIKPFAAVEPLDHCVRSSGEGGQGARPCSPVQGTREPAGALVLRHRARAAIDFLHR